MPKRDPDHAYDIIRLNMFFALSSILLFGFFMWIMWQDFSRDWKHYQAEFRRLDLAKTEAAARSELEAVRANPEYTQINAELKAATARQKQQQKDYEKALDEQKKMQGVWYRADQQFRFKKAEYESKRYDAEEAVADRPKDPKTKDLSQDLAKTKKQMDDLSAALDQVNDRKAAIDAKVEGFTKSIDDLEKERTKLRTKLDRIERKEENIAPSFANVFRNLPLVDFMDPSIKIQQVVVNGQTEDLNFLTVPRVDRCMTCHVGINQEGYEEGTEIPGYKKGDIHQPFATHPKIALFAGTNSKHPMETFGCTGCHLGRGRSTDFITAAHTPANEEESKLWEKKYNWHEMHHWDTPMYKKSFVEASCIKCHSGTAQIPEGDQINTARYLFIEYGCHGCHLTKGFENLPKVGPDLRHINAKVTKDWAAKWIENPKAFRPTTRMPRYFHNSNNSSPEDVSRNRVEIRSIVEFLFSKSQPIQYAKLTQTGDAANGKKLVHDIGCMGCHLTEGEQPASVNTRRRFGPPLIKLGSKTTPEWLYNWLKEPRHYAASTRMPNMRLSDQEALDITAYLISLRDTAWEQQKNPPLDGQYLKDEILYYLKRQYGLAAEAEYNKMSQQQRWEFLGEKAVQRYGCTGCHLIQGFENAKGIGTSLSEEGSKLLSKFDFGFVPIDHTVPAWVNQKLHNPRIYDNDRVKRWDEKLIMPNFQFSDEEADYLTMLVMGLTKERVPADSQRILDAREQVVEKGRWLVLQKNCVACHNIDGWGGEIRTVIQEPGMAPPALLGEGEKVQSDWLFQFLKSPGHIRPWLSVRMPNFRLSDEEANTLVEFFMASAQTGPFNTPPDINAHLSDGQLLFTTFQCSSCHVVGGQVPEGKTSADLAPDLTMASSRLRADWIVKWLDDPQKLLPGTRMPDFFPEAALPNVLNGDSEQQRTAIRNFLYSIGKGSQASISPPIPFGAPGVIENTAAEPSKTATTGGQ
jgi:mono/diheme cytochrome c family protein